MLPQEDFGTDEPLACEETLMREVTNLMDHYRIVARTFDPENPAFQLCHYECPSGRFETSIQPANTRCPPRIMFGP